jgi:transposase
MGKPYSMDLRERVIAAVKTGGMSCNRAAKQFGIGVSTAINWVKRVRETGSVKPGKMGGHKRKAISGEHRLWLLQRIKGASACRIDREPVLSPSPSRTDRCMRGRSCSWPAATRVILSKRPSSRRHAVELARIQRSG